MAFSQADLDAIAAAQAANPSLAANGISLLGIASKETGGEASPDTAVSSTGAVGLFQVLPSTAASPGYGVAPVPAGSLTDPSTSANFAASYLAGLLAAGKSPDAAIAQYSGGGYNLASTQQAGVTAAATYGVDGPYATSAANTGLSTNPLDPFGGGTYDPSQPLPQAGAAAGSALTNIASYLAQGGVILLGICITVVALIFLLVDAKSTPVQWKDLAA